MNDHTDTSIEQAGSSPEILENNHTTLPVAFGNFLTIEECDSVLSLVKDLESKEAELRSDRSAMQYDKRKSEVSWLRPSDDSQWLYQKIQDLITSCNEQYQFNVQGLFEGVQVATYNEGGHFDWHMDVGPGKLSLRKLAVTIQLSDASEYEGGELEFMGQEMLAPKEKGTAIVFPSFLFHRVRPVVSGKRVSIVTWVHGSAFK